GSYSMSKVTYIFSWLSLLFLIPLFVACENKSVNKAETVEKKVFDHPDFDYDETSGDLNADILSAKSEPKYNPEDSKNFQLVEKEQLESAVSFCEKSLAKVPNPMKASEIKKLCQTVSLEKSCYSNENAPIFHYDRKGYSSRGKRILTISLIHGDEHASGTVATHWMNRLEGLNPRNAWRVIPVVNPDGWAKNSRVNAREVDINRNFPSNDWDKLALEWWKTKKNSDPRRYPGPSASSEPETRCLIKHINEFKPDFIIAVHTPLGVLDFDGPHVKAPNGAPLPWQRLGNFPGSLGRYMWVDHNVPVLTIELRGSDGLKKLAQFDHLQDISGSVAIQAGRALNKTKNKN
ncbi:MAG: M14 family zinc carboxypeptidase, partial [Bdellovibrionales bacterium]